jgi:hypothetical protein
MVEQAAIVLSNPDNLNRMADLAGTRDMVCLDNLPPDEVNCLMRTALRIPNEPPQLPVANANAPALPA